MNAADILFSLFVALVVVLCVMRDPDPSKTRNPGEDDE